jgi:hypothetical protein
MANSTATPTLLTSPGYLFWAPLASTLPTNTVAGSVFTDSWPVAWINLGATDDGSTISYESKVEAINVAEFFDPIQWVTTGREGGIAFALASWTLNNLKRVLNGGSLTVVSGTGATALNKYEPLPRLGGALHDRLGVARRHCPVHRPTSASKAASWRSPISQPRTGRSCPPSSSSRSRRLRTCRSRCGRLARLGSAPDDLSR